MDLDRRAVLSAATALAAAGCGSESGGFGGLSSGDAWDRVRAQFVLDRELIDMSAMLLASHPRDVREAIERHRRALDHDTVGYLESNNRRLTDAARAAAGGYVGVPARHIALTDSTTMGVGLIYGGLRLRPGDEILTSEQDYFVTHEAVRLACLRTGARELRVNLHGETPNGVSAEALTHRLIAGITPRTRALGVTWVHSSTGLKMPIRQIADALGELNRRRDEDDRILLCVDGVHGFGVEDETLGTLGCDFIAAGCHKWLFGPRGTGVVAGRDGAWRRVDTTVPSFLDDQVFDAWLSRRAPQRNGDGARFSPGGFKAFEHLWALPEAFALHEAIGRSDVAHRTHELATQLKEGLAQIGGVTLATPASPELSAGIVSFDVDGVAPPAFVSRLRQRNIVASAAPYARQWVRVTPSIRNTPREVDAVLSEIRGLVG
jgi:isopenicillin-N epimerase